jgi:hypothetical protein
VTIQTWTRGGAGRHLGDRDRHRTALQALARLPHRDVPSRANLVPGYVLSPHHVFFLRTSRAKLDVGFSLQIHRLALFERSEAAAIQWMKSGAVQDITPSTLSD